MSNLKVIQLLPELNFGGVERGVKDFSKALVDRGHQSIVISNGGLLQEEIENNGAKHINLPIHKKRISSLFLASQLKEIYEKEKPEIANKQLSWKYLHVKWAKPGVLDSFVKEYGVEYKKSKQKFMDWVKKKYDPIMLEKNFRSIWWVNRLVDDILKRE